MLRIFLTTLMSIALATVAFAAGDVMASRYGNTTVSTDAKGNQTKVYYNADHTFSYKAGAQQGKGTWKVDDGKVCLTYEGTPPAGFTNPFCAPIVEHKVGDMWTVGDGDNKRTIKLEKGIL